MDEYEAHPKLCIKSCLDVSFGSCERTRNEDRFFRVKKGKEGTNKIRDGVNTNVEELELKRVNLAVDARRFGPKDVSIFSIPKFLTFLKIGTCCFSNWQYSCN